MVSVDHEGRSPSCLRRPQPRLLTQAEHEVAFKSNWLVSGIDTCLDSLLCLIVYHDLRELDHSSNSRRPWVGTCAVVACVYRIAGIFGRGFNLRFGGLGKNCQLKNIKSGDPDSLVAGLNHQI